MTTLHHDQIHEKWICDVGLRLITEDEDRKDDPEDDAGGDCE